MKSLRITKPDDRVPKLNLTTIEAADALNINEKTVRAMARAGKIPHIRNGTTYLFPVIALERWLIEQTLSK